MEARAGIEPAIKVLQTSALPLGYLAVSVAANLENARAVVNRLARKEAPGRGWCGGRRGLGWSRFRRC